MSITYFRSPPYDSMPSAYILMKCADGAEHKIIKNLAKTDTVSEVQTTIGHYDLIAKITSTNTYHMDEVIQTIHRDEGVQSTKVLRTYD